LIVDASIILGWLGSKYEKECLSIKEKFERGLITLKVPSIVKYEVCKFIANDVGNSISPDVASKLSELLLMYLSHISVELNERDNALAVKLSCELNIDLSVASCLVLSTKLWETYLTAYKNVAKLRKFGYPILHITEI